MTDTPTVTQADIDAAKLYIQGAGPWKLDEICIGPDDNLVQAFARHRIASTAELADALRWYAEQFAGRRKITSEGEQARNALDADLIDAPTQSDPDAMRYSFDGFGYKYIDSSSGSDWRTRHPDAEPLYASQPTQSDALKIPTAALDALRNDQKQIDEDGVMVVVSRQALHEVLAALVKETPVS
jgi:hypothetical protein